MIQSQSEILSQAKMYLTNVSEQEYNEILKPNFISSAGAHMRHIIDHYKAIKAGIKTNYIDYDVRLRGGEIEKIPEKAIAEIDQIIAWIKELKTDDLNKTIHLSTEVSILENKIAKVQTTLARELVFAGSHAVHHFAMIAQIALAQKSKVPPYFGIAPATATYLRNQKCAH